MKQLLALLARNADRQHTITAQASGSGPVDVYLKGVISADWGVSATDLRQALQAAEGADVVLHINSPGGDVFEAREMQAVITGYSGNVTAQIEGVAASAATIVSMSAGRVTMLKGSRYMIHNGWSLTIGDKAAHQATAQLLQGFDTELAAEYARKTGADVATVAAWMDAETWFNADEALQHKFVDALVDNTKNAADLHMWNLSAYANAPAAEPAAPQPDYQALHAANRRRLRLLQIA